MSRSEGCMTLILASFYSDCNDEHRLPCKNRTFSWHNDVSLLNCDNFQAVQHEEGYLGHCV